MKSQWHDYPEGLHFLPVTLDTHRQSLNGEPDKVRLTFSSGGTD